MAFPCCDNCYTIYLDEEGEPIPEVFKRIFGAGAYIVKEPAPMTDMLKWHIERGHPHPIWSYVVINGEKKSRDVACLCPCHQRGCVIMH